MRCSLLNLFVVFIVAVAELGTDAAYQSQQIDSCVADSCENDPTQSYRMEYNLNLVDEKATVNKSANSSIQESERFANDAGVWLNVEGDSNEEGASKKNHLG